jgi:hypothetical protein
LAETIKSALLFDYESLQRSLGGSDTRLADRASAWVAAIETGRLIGPQGTRRRLVMRKCYAGPSVLGKQRDSLGAAGFDVVDCGANDGNGRSSSDIHMAIDTIDGLSRADGPEEFILMTASSDLGPLLARLKASKRMAVVFADASLADKDRSLADTLLDRSAFAAFLASDETPVGEERPAAGGATDRAEIEAFARRIHAATNIPLFSPKTYAELFKHLTDEIRENGYHFQTTARNVAERMTEAGRSVTRRQVVFIVKGLALKGHVFSTSDTPDRLAEVFREQARYLITNAGLSLDTRQDQLLNAWFASKAPVLPPAPERPKPRPAAPASNGAKPSPPPPAPAAKIASPPPAIEERTRQPDPPRTAKPQPAAKQQPAYVKPVDLPKSTAKPVPPMKAAPSPAAREEAKAVIAARIAASAKLKPTAKPAPPAKPAAKGAPPAPAKSSAPRKGAAEQTPDELETSILAAIAEAVDVLVDDSAKQEPEPEEAAPPAPAKRKPAATTQKPAEPERTSPASDEDDDAEGGDIGDQIQRIIASYNRNRSDT